MNKPTLNDLLVFNLYTPKRKAYLYKDSPLVYILLTFDVWFATKSKRDLH